MMSPQYIHLPPTSSLEQMNVASPFAAVVAIDTKVTPEWRRKVSEWLVEKGCLYMMAHGDECSLWDDSVDWANIEACNFEDIPEDKFVLTSWHEDESLEEVFYFALNSLPFYPLIENIVVLDISKNPREQSILARYKAAQDELDGDKKLPAVEDTKATKTLFATIFGAILGTLALPILVIILLKYL